MHDLPPKITPATPEETFGLEKKKKLKELILKLKRIDRSIERSKSDIKNCLAWERTHHEGELLQANFHLLKRGMDKIVLLDWENEAHVTLDLNPQLKPQDEIKKRFKTAKKLKLGIEPQQKHLENLGKQHAQISEEIQKVEQTTNLNDFLLLYPKNKKILKKIEPKSLIYREYVSKTGFKILAGKNSSCNDTLTFSVANGNDLWLHVKDLPGSHVVIKLKKGLDVDQETIDDAIQIAIFHSKAKNMSHAEVCLTEQKYVSRFGKNKDGKVQLSKHKVLYAKADAKKFKEIQQRAV